MRSGLGGRTHGGGRRVRRAAAVSALGGAVLLLVLAVFPAAGTVGSSDEIPADLKVPVHAALSQGAVTPGGTVQVAVTYVVPADAHIQNNEYFFAKAVDGEPFVLGNPVLPASDSFEGEPVFKGQTTVFYTARLARELAPGRRVLKLDAGHQACIEKPIFACFPPADSVLELPVEVVPAGAATPAANQKVFASLHAAPPAPSDSLVAALEAAMGGGAAPAGGSALASGGASSTGAGSPPGAASPATPAVTGPGTTTAQGTSSPTTPGLAPPGIAGRLQAALARRSLLALLLVFLGGIASSFTPCVYPMIPITISYIGGRSRGKMGGFFLSIFFVLGIALMYSVLGIVAASTGALFGSAMQSTPVLLVVSAVFFAMGASMLGAFDLALPSGMQTRLQSGPRGGVVGALLMGIVTGLVASPCVGPVVVVLLTWVAQIGSIAYGFLLLFVFALGLGMLFLVIGTFAGALNALPQAGQWMDTIKHVFGVILLGMGIFYLRTLIGPSATAILAGVLVFMVGTFLGAFQRVGEDPPKSLLLRKGFGILLLLTGGFILLAAMARVAGIPVGGAALESAATTSSTSLERGLDWVSDDQAGRAQAQSQGKPAVIDFYADWCGACKELDEKTWSDPAVQREGQRFVAIKMDLTRKNDWSARKQTDYGVPGLPTVIFYKPNGEEATRFFGFRPPRRLRPSCGTFTDPFTNRGNRG